jgi:hypothetical protein
MAVGGVAAPEQGRPGAPRHAAPRRAAPAQLRAPPWRSRRRAEPRCCYEFCSPCAA